MKIRLLSESDAEKYSEYYESNKKHFAPWEPERPLGFHSVEEWQKRILVCVQQQSQGEAAYFVAELEGRIAGHCNLSNVVRGAFLACYMGYGVAKIEEGKGIAYEMCRVSIDYAFNELKLHRIMANYVPYNNRSARLLNRMGFEREGLAKNYLKIAGKWQNHVLMSLTNKNF